MIKIKLICCYSYVYCILFIVLFNTETRQTKTQGQSLLIWDCGQWTHRYWCRQNGLFQQVSCGLVDLCLHSLLMCEVHVCPYFIMYKVYFPIHVGTGIVDTIFIFPLPEIASIWEWKATSPMSVMWCLHEFPPTLKVKSRSAWEIR